MARGLCGPALVLAIVTAAAADEPHAIWSSSSRAGRRADEPAPGRVP